MRFTLLAATAMAVAATGAHAQNTSATPVRETTTIAVPTAAPAPQAGPRVLRGGAALQVRFLNEVTTEDRASSVGDRIRLEVASDVVLDGAVVIPAGTPVTGELTAVRNKGMWGRSGKIEGRLVSLSLNGRIIRMSGAFDDRGVTGTAGVVAAVVLVPVVGFFVTGTSARIPAGSEVTGYVDEDVEFLVTQVAAPAPIAIAAEVPALSPTVAVTPQ
jgi:hypothetical protein